MKNFVWVKEDRSVPALRRIVAGSDGLVRKGQTFTADPEHPDVKSLLLQNAIRPAIAPEIKKAKESEESVVPIGEGGEPVVKARKKK